MRPDIEELEDKFSIEGELGFAELEGDMVFVTIANKYAEAEISLYGGQVTHFRPQKTMGILWMSPESNFQEGIPIRGGIPVCFPWFGQNKTNTALPMHGFARLMHWTLSETANLPSGETLVRLLLCSSPETKKFWEHDFCAGLEIIVGNKLTVKLKVTNTSENTIDYTCALHSYFNISSVEEIAIYGLQNTKYYDQLQSGEFIQESPELKILKAETRHYLDTENTTVLVDPHFNRKIHVEKAGSKVTTVWNPGEETCKSINDIPDEAYHTFVCIETVNAFNDAVHLAPGEAHETVTVIG